MRQTSVPSEDDHRGGRGNAVRLLPGAGAIGLRQPAAAVGYLSRYRPHRDETAVAVAGAAYAGIVGSFSRYSRPATVAVVSLGCLMHAIGRPRPTRPGIRPQRCTAAACLAMGGRARRRRRVGVWAAASATAGDHGLVHAPDHLFAPILAIFGYAAVLSGADAAGARDAAVAGAARATADAPDADQDRRASACSSRPAGSGCMSSLCSRTRRECLSAARGKGPGWPSSPA